MRGEVGRATAAQSSLGRGKPPTRAKGLSPTPWWHQPQSQHCWSCRLAPWSLRGDSVFLFSITSFAGSVWGGRRQCLWRVLSQPGCPQEHRGALEPSLLQGHGWAASAVLPHCTSPIPAAITLHLGALTSGHFLPTLVYPTAGIKYRLLF